MTTPINMKKDTENASMLTCGGILKKAVLLGRTVLVAGTILAVCQQEDGPLHEQASTPNTASDQYGELVDLQLEGTDLGNLGSRITGVIEELQQNPDRDGRTDGQLRSLAARFAAQPPPGQAMLDLFSLNTSEVKLFLAFLRDVVTLTYAQAGLDVQEYATTEAQ